MCLNDSVILESVEPPHIVEKKNRWQIKRFFKYLFLITVHHLSFTRLFFQPQIHAKLKIIVNQMLFQRKIIFLLADDECILFLLELFEEFKSIFVRILCYITCAKRLSSQKHFNHCKMFLLWFLQKKADSSLLIEWNKSCIKWSQVVYFGLGDRILQATLLCVNNFWLLSNYVRTSCVDNTLS